MQLLKTNLDGSYPQFVQLPFLPSRQAYIDATVAASGEAPGYLCVSGENLDAEAPEERTLSCVAIAGVLVTHNLLVEKQAKRRLSRNG